MQNILSKCIIPFTVFLAAFGDPPHSIPEISDPSLEKAQPRDFAAEALKSMEIYRAEMIENSRIIVIGRVQIRNQDVVLNVVEFLKAPKEFLSSQDLPLGEGVEPGRNIPILNDLVITMFDDDMNILHISSESKFYPNFELWRTSFQSNE